MEIGSQDSWGGKERIGCSSICHIYMREVSVYDHPLPLCWTLILLPQLLADFILTFLEGHTSCPSTSDAPHMILASNCTGTFHSRGIRHKVAGLTRIYRTEVCILDMSYDCQTVSPPAAYYYSN